MKGCRVIDTEPRATRANPPGDYVCPNCGEHLSGPARFYTCPDAHFGVSDAVLRQPEERGKNAARKRLLEVAG